METAEERVRREIAERVRGGHLIPTPNAMDYVNGTEKPMRDGRTRDCFLKHYISRLYGRGAYGNPAFYAEMMGFPIDYLTKPFMKDDEDGQGNTAAGG